MRSQLPTADCCDSLRQVEGDVIKLNENFFQLLMALDLIKVNSESSSERSMVIDWSV